MADRLINIIRYDHGTKYVYERLDGTCYTCFISILMAGLRSLEIDFAVTDEIVDFDQSIIEKET